MTTAITSRPTARLTVLEQGPDEPISLVGPEPRSRFIAQMDEGTIEEARHIVACVNAYPHLLAAVQAAVEFFCGQDRSEAAEVAAVRKLKAAIEAAQGKPA